jgi:flagellar assembly protein FliH
MAKSKLIGEFGEDGSPLSAFNVSKAMAKAKEAAFVLKTGESKIGGQPFRKVSWNEVAPLVDLSSEADPELVVDPEVEPGSADSASGATSDGEDCSSETVVAEDDGWDEALQSADGAPQGDTAAGDGAAAVQAEPLSLTPDPPPPAVIDKAQKEEIREEAYNEGFSAGKAMTESAREAELDGRIADLDRVITALTDPDLLDTEMLSMQIKQSVLSMAKARAGSQIDNFPEPFIARLETMLRNVQHMSGKRELFVSQADLAVIKAGLPAHKDLAMITMHVDPNFGRGDVKLRVGGGEITDLYEEVDPSKAPGSTASKGPVAGGGDLHESSGVAAPETADNGAGETVPAVTEVATSQDVTPAPNAPAAPNVTSTPDHAPDVVPLIVSEEVAPAEELIMSEDVVLSEELLVSDEVIMPDETTAPLEVMLKND